MKVTHLIIGTFLAGTTMCLAEEFAVRSFNGEGRLVFNVINIATNYHVEWASSPAGPWTNFTGAAGASLDNIPPVQSGSITCSVPMFYRVVASVTNAPYVVVDISAGTSAENFPVSYLASVPPGGWSDEYKATKIVLRRVPAAVSAFTMGAPSGELGWISDEIQHLVTLSQEFYICVFEVTQKQWERVMGTWPSYFNNVSYRDTRPVETVSYANIRGSTIGANWPASSGVDESSFIGMLRLKTGKTFDLPTEAQWEYACRAGTSTALNSGSNLTSTGKCPNMGVVGRYWFNGGSGYTQSGDPSVGTAKVGSYLPNAWGLYDMHGNVWEWCLDWYGVYPGTVNDPVGASTGTYRVYRGGRWFGTDFVAACDCRSARRSYETPGATGNGIGFRVVLPISQ